MTKEPIGTKGCRVTAQISLPGRFLVYMPYASKVGVSRKIESREQRAKLREMVAKLLPKDAKPELKALVDGLVAPTLLYDQGVDLYLGSRQERCAKLHKDFSTKNNTVENQAYADITFGESWSATIGDEKVWARYDGPGHTGGDSVVFVPDAKVAFCGDLLWQGSLPNTIDASTAPWIATLDTLAKESSYTFVPGHGDVAKAQDVTAFQNAELFEAGAQFGTEVYAPSELAQPPRPLPQRSHQEWREPQGL